MSFKKNNNSPLGRFVLGEIYTISTLSEYSHSLMNCFKIEFVSHYYKFCILWMLILIKLYLWVSFIVSLWCLLCILVLENFIEWKYKCENNVWLQALKCFCNILIDLLNTFVIVMYLFIKAYVVLNQMYLMLVWLIVYRILERKFPKVMTT